MSRIQNLLNALDERAIAQRVAKAHDEARLRYTMDTNTVSDFYELEEASARYLEYHFTTCISPGRSLSRPEARSRAKDILTREYQRKGGDIVTAYNDAHDGTNGGLRGIFDIICTAMKNEAIELYIRDQFDRHLLHCDIEEKVKIIRQIIAHCSIS
jgi:hypothetical protein